MYFTDTDSNTGSIANDDADRSPDRHAIADG